MPQVQHPPSIYESLPFGHFYRGFEIAISLGKSKATLREGIYILALPATILIIILGVEGCLSILQ
jgi:hypothetical protein